MADEATILSLAKRLATFEIAFDTSAEIEALAPDEQRRVVAYAVYEIQRTGRSKPQRTALALFRSWLTADQRREIARRGFVTVVAESGAVYRLHPKVGLCERVERHGKNWYRVAKYCYHDVEGELPDADVSLAHLLILSTDEARFLAEANETKTWPQCWDSDYMRRRAEIRRTSLLERAA